MNFYYRETLDILLKTLPYLLVRMGIYSVLGVAGALIIGLLLLLGKVFGGGGVIFFLIGVALLVGLVRVGKQYALYLVDAGHIAVITELLQKGSLPEGVNQFQYGKDLVTRMFKEVSVLFLVDRLVDGTIRAINRTVAAVTDILPLPGIEGLTKIANSVINFSLTYVDETILSYNLSRGDENIWESAKRGVILYAQNWKPLLITAAACTVANFVAFVVVLLIFLVPFGVLAAATHNETLKFFWFAVAFTLAYGVKLALFKPFFQTSMIITFREAVKGQVPNPQWEDRLETVSDKFRELKDKAAGYMKTRAASAHTPPPTN
ncbi:hypothetical protein [Syntrophobacter fumaroxidans]|uniref:Uncharacterized protein n=1 Tax=Syntrophobacter fumaroxidans (strain DSM 10017 / MPOB) TaxID=335543 RepID=A0LJB6_SYNFM|nr:hypothetical protein [Syntrophobacter fumaroxidans]ABK17518.1 conserved hypothetical protein [Syntrophobacter fumaroxidans MPOB]